MVSFETISYGYSKRESWGMTLLSDPLLQPSILGFNSKIIGHGLK